MLRTASLNACVKPGTARLPEPPVDRQEDPVVLAWVVDVRVERPAEPDLLDHEDRGDICAERHEEVAQGGGIERRREGMGSGDVGVHVERRQGPDEACGEEALAQVTPGGVHELLDCISGADRTDEQCQVVQYEPGAVVDVAHEEVHGHHQEHDDERNEDGASSSFGLLRTPQLLQRALAHEQLEDDRERDPDHEVDRLPLGRLTEIEDEADGDPHHDEGDSLGNTPRSWLRYWPGRLLLHQAALTMTAEP
jgi:hypothetical protein